MGLVGVGEGMGESLAMEMEAWVRRLAADLVFDELLGVGEGATPGGSGGVGAGGPSSIESAGF